MFSRIANLIKGFFSSLIGAAEKKNPEMLLENEKENLRKQITKFNQGLAGHAGLVEKLASQQRKLEKEEKELRDKTAANLRAGNRDLAAQFALKLKEIDGAHADIQAQAEEAEARYKELVKARDVSVREAKTRIEQLSRDLDGMKATKAMAELNEMASGMITSIGGSGDTLNRLEEMVEEERTRAAGRARVAKDQLDFDGINAKASEQDALADLALAEFAAEQGIALEPTSGGATQSQDQKSNSIGPQSESN